MKTKIFFDMDGVLVDFAGGWTKVLLEAIEFGDLSSKSVRRLASYEGPDVQEITPELVEQGTIKRDAKEERTKFEKRLSDAIMSVAGAGTADDWANLPALSNFHAMIDAAMDKVGAENVYVCTAPIGGLGGPCENGKRSWISTNTNIYAENVFITEDKGSIAQMFPEDTCILVDDRTKYCAAWEQAGGVAIHHEPPANDARVQATIQEINSLPSSLSV